MSTILIFTDINSASEAHNFACQAEGLGKNGTTSLFAINEHPDESDSRTYIWVPEPFTNRSWYSEFESKVDEVVSELSKDWFGDYD
jgi:hypothetical protein